jgi:hypothetical protein
MAGFLLPSQERQPAAEILTYIEILTSLRERLCPSRANPSKTGLSTSWPVAFATPGSPQICIFIRPGADELGISEIELAESHYAYLRKLE